MTIPLPDPLDPFELKAREFFFRHNLLARDGNPPRFREWAIAVSGGGDSVFLCHLLHRLATPPIALTVLHFNHHTDKNKNQDDQEFVENLSRRLGLPFHSACSPSSDLSRRNISETVLRKERHSFFESYLSTHPHSAIFLGHQLDDRIETVLANLFRGGGPRSLIGIAEESRGRIFRPLLGFGREEIRQALVLAGLPYRDDPANMDPAHLRNRIRLTLRGEIDRFFPPHGSRHLGHLATLMERETSPNRIFTPLLCEEESPGKIRFSLFMYQSLRPSAQGLFLRSLLNRQGDFGLPLPPERNLLRTLEQAEPGKSLLNYPIGKDWILSIVFGRTDLVYKYPESNKWRYDLHPGAQQNGFTATAIQLPRGGTLFVGRSPGNEIVGDRSRRPGMSTSFRLPDQTDPEGSFSICYWTPGQRVLPDQTGGSPRSVSSNWKNRPLPWSRKFMVPVLCRGPYALWIPGILDVTGQLLNDGSGSAVTLTYQVRERSEWKKFLENP